MQKGRFDGSHVVSLEGVRSADTDSFTMSLSGLLYPIPELHAFLFQGVIQGYGNYDPVVWEIDEEGTVTRFFV